LVIYLEILLQFINLVGNQNWLFRGLEKVADLIGAKPNEIFFTSGGTESDNLALKGLSKFYRDKDKDKITYHQRYGTRCSFRNLVELESDGFEVTYLEVGREGVVNPETIKNSK
jgi:cysteine desulfurase